MLPCFYDYDYHSDQDQAKEEGSPEHPLRQSFLVLVLCRVLHQMIRRLKVTQVRLKLAKTQLSQLSNQVHILGCKLGGGHSNFLGVRFTTFLFLQFFGLQPFYKALNISTPCKYTLTLFYIFLSIIPVLHNVKTFSSK